MILVYVSMTCMDVGSFGWSYNEVSLSIIVNVLGPSALVRSYEIDEGKNSRSIYSFTPLRVKKFLKKKFTFSTIAMVN